MRSKWLLKIIKVSLTHVIMEMVDIRQILEITTMFSSQKTANRIIESFINSSLKIILTEFIYIIKTLRFLSCIVIFFVLKIYTRRISLITRQNTYLVRYQPYFTAKVIRQLIWFLFLLSETKDEYLTLKLKIFAKVLMEIIFQCVDTLNHYYFNQSEISVRRCHQQITLHNHHLALKAMG